MKAKVSDIELGPVELYAARYWCEVSYRIGKSKRLRIESFSGLTKHDAQTAAKKRVNELLDGKGA